MVNKMKYEDNSARFEELGEEPTLNWPNTASGADYGLEPLHKTVLEFESANAIHSELYLARRLGYAAWVESTAAFSDPLIEELDQRLRRLLSAPISSGDVYRNFYEINAWDLLRYNLDLMEPTWDDLLRLLSNILMVAESSVLSEIDDFVREYGSMRLDAVKLLNKGSSEVR